MTKSQPSLVRPLVGALFGSALLTLVFASCSKKEKEPEPKLAQTAQAVSAPAPVAPPEPPKCEPGPDGRCQPSSTCSPDCKPIATPACVKCEASGDCAAFASNCESSLLSEADRKTCYDILTCVQTSGCFVGPKTTLGSCYCGKLKTKECLAAPMSGPGSPDGVCRDLILKGMPSAQTQSQVLGNFTTRTHAAGLALSRLNCQKIGFKKTCTEICGFGPK